MNRCIDIGVLLPTDKICHRIYLIPLSMKQSELTAVAYNLQNIIYKTLLPFLNEHLELYGTKADSSVHSFLQSTSRTHPSKGTNITNLTFV